MKYDRQTSLKHIGQEGQKKLSESVIAIIGLGAVGSCTSELLTRAGVGKLILIDHDIVDETNLQRQLLYDELDLGTPKVMAAVNKLKKINSDVEIETRFSYLTRDNIDLDCDVILDCTDNLRTRFVINDYSLKNNIPWIYAGAVEDRVMLFVTSNDACFNCLFGESEKGDTCEQVGILNSASVIASSLQVKEALKILLGEPACKELIHVNVWDNEFKKIKVQKNKDCNACNGVYKYLEAGEDYNIEYCKSKGFMSSKPLKSMKLNMKKLKENFDIVSDKGNLATFTVDGEEVIVHDYGELLFKNTNKDVITKLAEKIYGVANGD